jgi:hypothetical protein
MRTVCLLLLLMVPVMAEAGADAYSPSEISHFEFRDVRFGQSPSYDMICEHGYCKSQAPGGDGRVTVPYDVYTRLSAPLFIAGVEIAPPKYRFWQDQLFGIKIPLVCSPAEFTTCADRVLSEIFREDPLILLSQESSDLVALEVQVQSRTFLSDSGALVSVVLSENQGRQSMFIDVRDKKLTDKTALALNPKYRPKPVYVPKE